MNDYSEEGIITYLIREFPDFQESRRWKDLEYLEEERMKLPYVIWGQFAEYAKERLRQYGIRDVVCAKLFELVNQQLNNEKTDPRLKNLIIVEIFENFAQTEEALLYARSHTTGKARHDLEMVLTATGVGKPDLTIAPEAEAHMQRLRGHIQGYTK